MIVQKNVRKQAQILTQQFELHMWREDVSWKLKCRDKPTSHCLLTLAFKSPQHVHVLQPHHHGSVVCLWSYWKIIYKKHSCNASNITKLSLLLLSTYQATTLHYILLYAGLSTSNNTALLDVSCIPFTTCYIPPSHIYIFQISTINHCSTQYHSIKK